jgi:aminocarboxymuconate-semialdehyde decarboxylase
MEREIITETERDAIWQDNVIQWLCGDDEKAKQKLVNRIIN